MTSIFYLMGDGGSMGGWMEDVLMSGGCLDVQCGCRLSMSGCLNENNALIM